MTAPITTPFPPPPRLLSAGERIAHQIAERRRAAGASPVAMARVLEEKLAVTIDILDAARAALARDEAWRALQLLENHRALMLVEATGAQS